MTPAGTSPAAVTPAAAVASPATAGTPFDAEAAYRLHDRVALRREPFGALAYHYGNRRLNFLRAPELAALVESLGEHASVRAAFDASGIDPRRWLSFVRALESLAGSGFLVRDEAP